MFNNIINLQITFMKQQVPSQFQKWHAIFRTRQKQLSKNVKNQLLFIASKIYDQPFEISLINKETVQQIEQLSQLGKKALLILFKTLIKTSLIQNEPVETDGKIKFKGFFQFWKDCKVKISGHLLIIRYQKITHQVKLKNIAIFNCIKSKRSFQIFIKKEFFATIKLSTAKIFTQFNQLLQSKIDELAQDEPKNKDLIKNLINKKQYYQRQQQQIIPSRISLQEQLSLKKDINQSKQKQSTALKDLSNIQQLLRKQQPQGFIISYQSENSFIFSSQKQPKINVILIIKTNLDLQKVVNFYLHQKQWNSAIITEAITQIQDNLLQVFRVYRKDSFFQLQRAAFTKVSIFCTKNSATVQQQSIKNADKKDKTLCQIKTTTKFNRCLGGIKITIDCKFDARGYCQPKDSALLLQKNYSDVKYFQNNIKINQQQKNYLKVLVKPCMKSLSSPFQKEPYLKQEHPLQKFKVQSSILNELKQGKQIENYGTNDTLDIPPKKQKDIIKSQMFKKLKLSKPTCIPTLDYINLVANKQYQRYFLKKRFDQSIAKNYDSSNPSYCLAQLLKRKQYIISKNKQLVFIDYEVIKGQKNSLLFIIKQVGANIISGKSVLNISLPVDIFQSRTLLQRSAACFGMAPDYLIPYADSDPLTQIKNIVTLFCNIPTLQLIMLKPFNPILGQTFQAYIKGIPIYYQQISHHPPISSFYMTCPQFTMHGNLVAFADVSLNSAVGGNEGITYIKMRNGSEFQCYFPPCEISGLILGDRTFRAYGKGFILQKNQNLFAQISIEKEKKGLYEKGDQKLYPGDIIGGIFKIDPKVMENIAHMTSLRKFSGLQKKNVQKKLASIRGTWFQEINIDNQVVNKNKKIYPLQYPKVALPSDANYRLDVLYHKLNDIPKSQHQKQILETQQRGDRKLRQKYAKALKKQNK